MRCIGEKKGENRPISQKTYRISVKLAAFPQVSRNCDRPCCGSGVRVAGLQIHAKTVKKCDKSRKNTKNSSISAKITQFAGPQSSVLRGDARQLPQP
ncbi:MAG TPA: hypothetical protein VFV65_06650, partial [Gemmatimonadales bacterium]|nr:hypothetical protein [Gemmatimonadales bacterium]